MRPLYTDSRRAQAATLSGIRPLLSSTARRGSCDEGQMSSSVHSAHRGFFASHTRRPCRIIRRLNHPTPPAEGSGSVRAPPSPGPRCVSRAAWTGADVGVDWQPRQTERHAAHDVARLASDTRKCDEVVQLGRHLAPEALDQSAVPCRSGSWSCSGRSRSSERSPRRRPDRRRRARRASDSGGTARESRS